MEGHEKFSAEFCENEELNNKEIEELRDILNDISKSN